jgi:hypothetical protein
MELLYHVCDILISMVQQAILETHGYKVHENYDPIWRHVRVPEPFLSLMCPDAERILEKIEGRHYLTILWLKLNSRYLFKVLANGY